MTSQIAKRTEVKSEETWDLTDLFLDFNHWNQAFSELPTAENLEKTIEEKFKGKLSSSPQVLFDCLQFKDTLSRKLENLYVYANLRSAEDTAENTSNECCGKIDHAMSELMTKFAFLSPEILSIPKLETWLKSEPLATYSYKLNHLLRSKPHILSEKEEALLGKLSVPLNVFDDIHSKWNNADMKFSNAKDSKGVDHIVSNSRYSLNLQSHDRTLRENTFSAYYTEVAKWRNTITSNYFGNMVTGSSLARIRNYNSFLECELFDDEVPVSLYDNLIQSVRKNLNLLHQSMQLRKKVLKIDLVAPYDRYVSLFAEEDSTKFSWEAGKDLVLKAIAPLGSEYVEIATKGLTTDRWIDRCENEGKRSGAFSWGTYESRPYMLQTWNGTLGDVYTLAHELGHSMHSYFSDANQPYHNAGYSIFVAEVASTLNEALLTDYILTNLAESDLAKAVISESVENFEGTVLRQVLFATFEQMVSKIADKGETFTPDLLEKIYFDLNKEWYGDASQYPEFIKHEWMRIPHFYTPFYVYKYATSYCSSLAIARKLKTDLEQGRKDIFSLLKAGGTKSPLDILKDAGIDLLTSGPIDEAFLDYQNKIQLAEKIFGTH